MALGRTEVTAGLNEELERFEGLVRELSQAELDTPTRCEGWTAGDVARHVVGSMSDVVNLRLDDVTDTQRQVDERKDRTAVELAEELAGVRKAAAKMGEAFDDDAWNAKSPGPFEFTLGQGVEALWHDAYIHTDDINSALGRTTPVRPALKGCISHIADTLNDRKWRPATLKLDGMPEFAVSGGGETITGDPFEFMLVATGRAPASKLGLEPDVNIYA